MTETERGPAHNARWTMTTSTPDETRVFGMRLADRLRPGDVVLLSGELGSGKTTLVQGICRGLGVGAWANSPTFTLINEYAGTCGDRPVTVYHCDFYRISDAAELETLALDEVFYGDGVALVEWPEVAEEWAPEDAVRITIVAEGPRKRRFEVWGMNEAMNAGLHQV